MGALKRTLLNEHHSGHHIQFEIDLGEPGALGFSGGSITADALGYTKGSISITSVGATGTTGEMGVDFSNTNNPNGSYPVSLTFAGPNATVELDLDSIFRRYIILNHKDVVFGTQGKIIIDIVLKQ